MKSRRTSKNTASESSDKNRGYDTHLNCFRKNKVSKRTVQGMIANFVIWNADNYFKKINNNS